MNFNNLILKICILFCFFSNHQGLHAQVGLGTNAPTASAILDLDSTTQGFLPPRMTQAQMSAIASPAAGLVVYCNDCTPQPGPYYYNGTDFVHFGTGSGLFELSNLDCAAATNTGTLYAFYPTVDTNFEIPFTVSEGGLFNQITVASTGVLGLQAVVFSRNLPTASTGNLDVHITGTPSSVGTATFPFSFGGLGCTLVRTVLPGPVVGSLNCVAATDATRVRLWNGYDRTLDVDIPYTAGNGEAYPLTGRDTFPSRGVTGLTATILPGTLANGSGNIQVRITGMPSGTGNASFDIDFGLQNCTLTRNVTTPITINGVTFDRAVSKVIRFTAAGMAYYQANVYPAGTIDQDIVTNGELNAIMGGRSFNSLASLTGITLPTNSGGIYDATFSPTKRWYYQLSSRRNNAPFSYSPRRGYSSPVGGGDIVLVFLLKY